MKPYAYDIPFLDFFFGDQRRKYRIILDAINPLLVVKSRW